MRLCIQQIYLVTSAKVIILNHQVPMNWLDCTGISFIVFFRQRVICSWKTLLHDSTEQFSVFWWLTIISRWRTSCVNEPSLFLLCISVLTSCFSFRRSWFHLARCSDHIIRRSKLLSIMHMWRLTRILLIWIRSSSVKIFVVLLLLAIAWLLPSWRLKLLSQSLVLKLHSHHVGLLLIKRNSIILDLLSHRNIRLQHFINHINAPKHFLGKHIFLKLHEVYICKFRYLIKFLIQKLLKSLIFDLSVWRLHNEFYFFLVKILGHWCCFYMHLCWASTCFVYHLIQKINCLIGFCKLFC